MKKIRLYINKQYICTSTSYKTCREFKNSVEKDGFVKWVSIPENGYYKLQPEDKIICRFVK